MKRIFYAVLAIASMTIVACNNNSPNDDHAGHTPDADHENHAAPGTATSIKTIEPQFASLDATVAATMRSITDNYLGIKNALVADNPAKAVEAGKALLGAIGEIDKSLLTAEQKVIFDQHIGLLKQSTENIIGQSGDISAQRQHFSRMSQAAYALVKAFGAGKPIYHDHCPMYNENKGGMWLSETREVKNPYYGLEMLNCGTVEELIQ